MVCARMLVSLSLLGAVPAFGDSSVATQVWNGTSWGSNAKVVAGSSVYVRYTISTNNTNAAALNFANFQPTIGGWAEGDSVNLGLTTGGSNGNPSAGVDSNFADGNGYGRVAAFAYANSRAANTLEAHTDVPGILRIAATPVTNAPGTGTSLNNFNGSGGVPLAQSIGGPGRAAGSPAIVAGTSVVVYGVAITLSGTRSIGTPST